MKSYVRTTSGSAAGVRGTSDPRSRRRNPNGTTRFIDAFTEKFICTYSRYNVSCDSKRSAIIVHGLFVVIIVGRRKIPRTETRRRGKKTNETIDETARKKFAIGGGDFRGPRNTRSLYRAEGSDARIRESVRRKGRTGVARSTTRRKGCGGVAGGRSR